MSAQRFIFGLKIKFPPTTQIFDVHLLNLDLLVRGSKVTQVWCSSGPNETKPKDVRYVVVCTCSQINVWMQAYVASRYIGLPRCFVSLPWGDITPHTAQWIFVITIGKDSLSQIDLAGLRQSYRGFLWKRSTAAFSFSYLRANLCNSSLKLRGI